MNPQERRLSTRKFLKNLSYLSLPSGNGGMVLDVSEGGLGFRSTGPIRTSGPIQFRFSVDSAKRITAVGEVAWKDATGKTGGLRFTQLPNDVREQIRLWAGQSGAGAKPQAALTANHMMIDVLDNNSVITADAAPAYRPVTHAAVNVAEAAPAATAALSSATIVETAAPDRDVPVAASAATTAVAAPRSAGLTAALIPGSAESVATIATLPAGREENPATASSAVAAPVRESNVAPASKLISIPTPQSGSPDRYDFRVSAYAAQANHFSMFAPDPNSTTTFDSPPPGVSVLVEHPFAAILLTITLAFLVSIGIFSYFF